jgi:hypothetical protein
MTLTSSSGTWLKDCLQPQHYYVSITIDDPDGKILARVSLSYEQAAKMLLYNGDVECTLDKYRDEQGKLVEEKVTPPETVHQRMKDRLKETHSSLAKRLEDARRDVFDKLTALEAADVICFQLQKFEKQQSKSEKEKSQLFGSNASAKQNKVNIRYITHQGTSTLLLEQARDYLRFLLTIKDIKEFKTHYWFKGDKNDT